MPTANIRNTYHVQRRSFSPSVRCLKRSLIERDEEKEVTSFLRIRDALLVLCTFAFVQDPWLNWIEHLTTDQKVGGSNPFGFTSCCSI